MSADSCLHPPVLSWHPDSSTETQALWEKAASFLSSNNSCERGGKTFYSRPENPAVARAFIYTERLWSEMTAEEWWLSPLRFHVSLFLLQCILAARSCLISPSWCLPIHRMRIACCGKLHLTFYLEKTWCFKTTSWGVGLMKKHSSSISVSSNMLGGGIQRPFNSPSHHG